MKMPEEVLEAEKSIGGVFAIFLTFRQQDDQTIERGQAWDVITTIIVCFVDGMVVQKIQDVFFKNW